MAIIDTYAFITKLEKTGITEESAKVIADEINSLDNEKGLATKTDITRIETQLNYMSVGIGIIMAEVLLKYVL